MNADRMKAGAAGSGGGLPSNVLAYWPFEDDYADKADTPHTLDTNNNVTLSDTQTKVGNYSAYFNAATDYLSYDGTLNDNKLSFGTADYTIEIWWYITGTHNGTWTFLADSGNANQEPCIGYNWSSDQFSFDRGSNYYDPDSPLSDAGQWTHIAYDRTGGTGYWYVDGTCQTDTASDSRNFTNSNDEYVIGNFNSGITYGGTFYIGDLVIYNEAIHAGSNFTPRTELLDY